MSKKHFIALADWPVAGANARLISQAPAMAQTLREELEALETWQSDANIPIDIALGIQISIDKIERVLQGIM